MLIRTPFLLALLLSTAALAQQRQPAQITTTPSATPQTLDALDKAGAWTSMGTIDPVNHRLMGAVFPVDAYGAKGNFVFDDGPVIQAALNAAAVSGGTALLAGHAYWNQTQALVIPKNVRLTCAAALPKNANKKARDYTANPCTIYQKNGTSLDLRGEIEGVGLMNDLLHFSPLGVGVTTRAQVTAFVNAFAGTGLSIGTDTDADSTGVGAGARAVNLFILGFSQCVAIDNLAAQVVLHDIAGDCTSGLSVKNSHDINDFLNIEFYPFATIGRPAAQTGDYWPITGISTNGGSGAIRVTFGASPNALPAESVPVTGEKLWVSPGNPGSSYTNGGQGAGGLWTVTAINGTQVDLQGSVYTPTASGTTTNGQTYVTVSSTANLAAGMNVSGTNIPAGAKIGAVWRTRAAISLDQAHPATGDGATSLTFTNGSPTYIGSGGYLFSDAHWRNGTGFLVTASEGLTCRGCFSFDYATGFDLSSVGTSWTGAGADSFSTIGVLLAPKLANQNLVPVALKFTGGFNNVVQGLELTSGSIHILNASPNTSTNPYQTNIVETFQLGGSSTTSTMLENGAYGGIMLRNLTTGSGGAILLDNANPVLPTFSGNRLAAAIYGTTVPGLWTNSNFFIGATGQTVPANQNATALGAYNPTGGAPVNFWSGSQAVDEKYWRWSGAGPICLQALDDPYSAFTNAICVTRTGGTVTGVNLYTSITMPSLPVSAGGGGLYVCVDTTGKLYKKAACP